jgi:hypothetical protein
VVSQPVIEVISLSDTNVTLAWTAVPGQSYQVQVQEDLNITNWSDLPPLVVAAGTTATFTDTNGIVAQRFYRVSLVP